MAILDDEYASAIAGAIASARTCFQGDRYVIKAEDAHGFVVTTQGGPDESRMDGHAQFDGDPFLVADIPLDADPDFGTALAGRLEAPASIARASVRECLSTGASSRSRGSLQRDCSLRLLTHPSQNRGGMADDGAVGKFERR
jgi:hypothetical protein